MQQAKEALMSLMRLLRAGCMYVWPKLEVATREYLWPVVLRATKRAYDSLSNYVKRHPGVSFSFMLHFLLVMWVIGDISRFLKDDVPEPTIISVQMSPFMVQDVSERVKEPEAADSSVEKPVKVKPVTKPDLIQPEPKPPVARPMERPKPPKIESAKPEPKAIATPAVKPKPVKAVPKKVEKIPSAIAKPLSKPELPVKPKPVKKSPQEVKKDTKAHPNIRHFTKPEPAKSLSKKLEKVEPVKPVSKKPVRDERAKPDITSKGGQSTASLESTELSSAELASMRQQIERCFKRLAGVSQSENLEVIVRAMYNKNGTLTGTPTIIGGTRSHPKFASAADMVLRAVYQCNELVMPVEKYEHWKEVIITGNSTSFGDPNSP